MKIFRPCLLACLLLGFSCKHNKTDIEIISLAPDLEIDMLSDSTFFNMVQIIVEYNGDIYMSVDQRMQIARMDKDLILKNTIGNKGRGPGEFTYLNNFAVDGDDVWVGDEKRSAFIKYTSDGKFISSIQKGEGRSDSDFRFCIENGKIYFSRPDVDNGTSLAVLGIGENETVDYMQFGEIKEFKTPLKTSMQNGRHVFVHGDDIITVPYSIPVIERYDKNSLKLKDVFDVTAIPEMDEWYKNAMNDPNLLNPRSTFSMTKDAYLHGNMLYILYFTPMSLLNKTPKEFIGALVFDVDGDKIEYVKRYTFSGKDIWKICVTDDYIYGAPLGYGELKRYPLKQ